MAIEFGGSVLLEKPVEEVWRFLTDPDRDTNWRRPHVLSSRKLRDGPLAVGSRSETVNKFWGKKETVVTEITAMDPPSSLSWRQVNKGTFVTLSGERGPQGSLGLRPAFWPGDSREASLTPRRTASGAPPSRVPPGGR